jgi:Na+/H+ antiporter
MHDFEVVILLLLVVTALAEITDKVRIPYPILLVLAGIAIGFIPGLPKIELDPEIVFLIFLPPVLYASAWSTSWTDFKKAKRPIILLATGCVVFTTCAVALIAHTFIPYFGWEEAFVLGAIISPPDAVAAAAATKGLNIPKRVTTILEGESLVNDATGLIAYKYAIAAIITGVFNFWNAGFQFLIVATGGIVVGLIVGLIFKWIHKITPDNSTNDTTLTILAPFVAYLVAERLHISGVLSVVACGLFLSRKSSEIFSQQTRLQAYGFWNTIIFILNGVIFILIGLQLPGVLESLQGYSPSRLITYGAIVSIAVIIGRIVWVYPGAYLPRLSKRIREAEPGTSIKLVTIVAWSGMRGIVSLAAALALPLYIHGTTAFPNRDLIIFLTFSVIFSTLVIQGLTLRPLVKLFDIQPDGRDHEHEQKTRLKLASSLIEHIEENYALSLSDEVLNQVKTKYEMRMQRIIKDETNTKLSSEQINEFHSIQQNLIQKERAMIIQLRNDGTIDDEVMRKIEYELDLEETRIILEKEQT